MVSHVKSGNNGDTCRYFFPRADLDLEGWEIRDVYYITAPAGTEHAQPGSGGLDVLVYDTYSSESVPWDDGTEVLRVCRIELVP